MWPAFKSYATLWETHWRNSTAARKLAGAKLANWEYSWTSRERTGDLSSKRAAETIQWFSCDELAGSKGQDAFIVYQSWLKETSSQSLWLRTKLFSCLGSFWLVQVAVKSSGFIFHRAQVKCKHQRGSPKNTLWGLHVLFFLFDNTGSNLQGVLSFLPVKLFDWFMFTESKSSESIRRDRESMKTEVEQTGNYQPLLVPN